MFFLPSVMMAAAARLAARAAAAMAAQREQEKKNSSSSSSGSTSSGSSSTPNAGQSGTSSQTSQNTSANASTATGSATSAKVNPKYQFYRQVICSVGSFSDKAWDLNLLGVRGWKDEVGRIPIVQDTWDDAIFALWKDAEGNEHCEAFLATVNPGKFSEYLNPLGDAHLVDGQYDYVVGKHKGQYTALNQAGEVRVWRDKDKDGKRSASEQQEYSGFFGLNVHAGGTGDRVGNSSAGGPAIHGGHTGAAYKRFLELVEKDPDKKIKFTLVGGATLPALPEGLPSESELYDEPPLEPLVPEASAPSDLFEYLRSVIQSNGTFATAPWEMNIIGIRGWLHGTGKVTNTQNAYDDTLYVLYTDGQGRKHVEDFKGSTDPGKFEQFYNAAGDAHLCDGQWKYKIGLHRGEYTALVQDGPVTVWRDKDKDAVRDANEITETGWFGINIHAAGSGSQVGTWSAGCQVIWGGKTGTPYKRFIELMEKDPDKKMLYTLVDSSKLTGAGFQGGVFHLAGASAPSTPPPAPTPEPEPQPTPAEETANDQYGAFRKVIESKGTFATGAWEMNILGIRGWIHGTGTVANTKNAYDDTLYVLYVDDAGKKHCEHFKGSTDPGSFEKFYNAAGDAHLIDGQYSYKIGMHQGKYSALVQAGEVEIWRDRDKDGIRDADEQTVYRGYFGINIHAAGSGTNVGNWSAGCQVIWGGQSGQPYQRFMTLMRKHPKSTMKYTLVDSSKLPANTPVS